MQNGGWKGEAATLRIIWECLSDGDIVWKAWIPGADWCNLDGGKKSGGLGEITVRIPYVSPFPLILLRCCPVKGQVTLLAVPVLL